MIKILHTHNKEYTIIPIVEGPKVMQDSIVNSRAIINGSQCFLGLYGIDRLLSNTQQSTGKSKRCSIIEPETKRR